MRQESGRSMIEMMGVLAIMGVITVGAIAAISSAMNMQKRNEVNDEVLQMVTQVRQIFSEFDDYADEEAVIKRGSVVSTQCQGFLFPTSLISWFRWWLMWKSLRMTLLLFPLMCLMRRKNILFPVLICSYHAGRYGITIQLPVQSAYLKRHCHWEVAPGIHRM